MSDPSARRPSVDLPSFEDEHGPGAAEAPPEMFESETRSEPAGSPFRLGNISLGKGNSIDQPVAGQPLESDYSLSGGSAKSAAAKAKSSLYESSNKVSEDDIEDKLEQQARAAGFVYTPENCMQSVFILLDDPESGFFASVIGKIIMLLIMMSSFCLIGETYPPWGPCADPVRVAYGGYPSADRSCEVWDTTAAEAQKMVDTFHLIETVVIITFTVEYLLRVLLCTYRPRRNRRFWPYVIKPLNVVDFISIAPWWLVFFFGGRSGLAVVRLARMARVFRLLKAGSFLKELQLFVWGYVRAREGLLLLFFLLFMYLACFGAILYLVEYDSQSEACFAEAGFPECWGTDAELGKPVVQWDTAIEFGQKCHHCSGNLWNCTFAPAVGPRVVRRVDRMGDCVGENDVLGRKFSCDPFQPHYTDSECRTCSDVEWPGKEPKRCWIRPFTSIPVTMYFIMTTMTTVGYGEHYPGSFAGKCFCGVAMTCGIMVLALPMTVIGQAFEETIREEKTSSLERERQVQIMALEVHMDRMRTERLSIEAGNTKGSRHTKMDRDELENRLKAEKLRLDGEKAEREKYDAETARLILVNLLHNLSDMTDDDRFSGAVEALTADP